MQNVQIMLISASCIATLRKKNGMKAVPQGYYLIVHETVPLGVPFWYHIGKRVLFSTQFLYKNGANLQKRYCFPECTVLVPFF